MQILTNHRPRSHITTTATNDSALWFSITARFPNTVVISYNIGVISLTNDATSGKLYSHMLVLHLMDVHVYPLVLFISTLQSALGDICHTAVGFTNTTQLDFINNCSYLTC